MAGIYLHVPFCRQACHYCDFHFSTNLTYRREMVEAMAGELLLRRGYLEGQEVQTIYFGGGTPSVLDAPEIELLMTRIRDTHRVSAEAEITLEANPDDLTESALSAFRSLGVNRLSIGLQSFDDTILAWMNRTHTAETGIRSVDLAHRAGFENISIDLIYAIPGLSTHRWEQTVAEALGLETAHISAYTLTIEEKTTLGRWLKTGKVIPVPESIAAEQMERLVSMLTSHGYRHYEISNFARPGFESAHNTNYWSGGVYLGIGPGAHSFNRRSRQQNIANNHLYIRAIREERIPAEEERLNKEEQINEYILTSLRTDTGCDLRFLKDAYGYDIMAVHNAYLDQLRDNALVKIEHLHLRLTEAGRLLADKISSDLFLVET